MLSISRPLYLVFYKEKKFSMIKQICRPIIPRPLIIFLLQTSDPMPEAVSASA